MALILPVTAPVTAQSVLVRPFSTKTEATGTLDVHFDNVHFSPTPPVPVLSSWALTLLAGLLFGGGFWMLQRRHAAVG